MYPVAVKCKEEKLMDKLVQWEFFPTTVKASYKTPLVPGEMRDLQLDEEIKIKAKELGLRWYAQGYNFITSIRDICFDRPQRRTASV
jgi:hypothetical protein